MTSRDRLKLASESHGQGLAEYLIIVFLVALLVLLGIRIFGKSIRCQFLVSTGKLDQSIGSSDYGCPQLYETSDEETDDTPSTTNTSTTTSATATSSTTTTTVKKLKKCYYNIPSGRCVWNGSYCSPPPEGVTITCAPLYPPPQAEQPCYSAAADSPSTCGNFFSTPFSEPNWMTAGPCADACP